MEERYRAAVEVVGRFADRRQGDVVAIITTVLSLDQASLAEQHASLKGFTEVDEEIEAAVANWGDPATALPVRRKSPTVPGGAPTAALIATLRSLEQAPADRQEVALMLMEMMIENDSKELDMTPEERKQFYDAIENG
jgi:hypothetical protein